MRTSLIFIYIMTLASQVLATTDCRVLADTVKPHFLKTLAEDYYPLMCSDNVLKLKMNLLDDDIQLKNAYVVVLRHKAAPYLEVVPLMPRLTFKENIYPPPRWLFHVFLVVEGLVFDMDYTDVPKAVGLDTYMRTMWDQNKMADYVVQMKTLESYLLKDTFGTFANADVLLASELVEYFSQLSCTLSNAID